jgi:hypothetical protein
MCEQNCDSDMMHMMGVYAYVSVPWRGRRQGMRNEVGRERWHLHSLCVPSSQ